MQLRLLLGAFIVLIVFSIIRRPFKNRAKVRELVNHMFIALGTYYGSYALFSMFGVERNQGISAAIAVTCVVLVVVNMFFRKN